MEHGTGARIIDKELLYKSVYAWEAVRKIRYSLINQVQETAIKEQECLLKQWQESNLAFSKT